MKKTILAFGEVLWDILPSCTVLGGAPFNFTYRVNSLGDTGLMASRLGRDDLGRKAFDKIALLGLDTTLLQWDDEVPTGTVQVSFDAAGNPDYVIVRNVAYDRISIAGRPCGDGGAGGLPVLRHAGPAGSACPGRRWPSFSRGPSVR